MAKLIAHPDAYHGKAVWVVAHVTIEFENMTVCPSGQERQVKKCLWLKVDDGPYETDQDMDRYESKRKRWESYSHQTIALHATFDKNEHGHFGLWPGGLRTATEVMGHEGGWNFTTNSAMPRSACADQYALTKQPADQRAMLSGNRKLRRGDIDGAIADFDRAIAAAPSNSGYYLIRASAKEKKRDYAGTVADYTRAIELAREDKDVLYGLRAAAKEQAGDLDGAIADYTKAIEINPKGAEAIRRRDQLNQKKAR